MKQYSYQFRENTIRDNADIIHSLLDYCGLGNSPIFGIGVVSFNSTNMTSEFKPILHVKCIDCSQFKLKD
jgi:hypothetical protein